MGLRFGLGLGLRLELRVRLGLEGWHWSLAYFFGWLEKVKRNSTQVVVEDEVKVEHGITIGLWPHCH